MFVVAVSRAIVEAHGGYVTVQPGIAGEGQGAGGMVIAITLPLFAIPKSKQLPVQSLSFKHFRESNAKSPLWPSSWGGNAHSHRGEKPATPFTSAIRRFVREVENCGDNGKNTGSSSNNNSCSPGSGKGSMAGQSTYSDMSIAKCRTLSTLSTVLVMDPLDLSRRMLVRVLSARFDSVVQTTNTADLLEEIATALENGIQYFAVIIDCDGASGEDAIRAIRSLGYTGFIFRLLSEGGAVMAMTHSGAPSPAPMSIHNADTALQKDVGAAGASGTLMKPFDIDEFYVAINRATFDSFSAQDIG